MIYVLKRETSFEVNEPLTQEEIDRIIDHDSDHLSLHGFTQHYGLEVRDNACLFCLENEVDELSDDSKLTNNPNAEIPIDTKLGIQVESMDKNTAICILDSSLCFPTQLNWYAPSKFLPEPNDPVLLAIYCLKTGNISFEIGYAEWETTNEQPSTIHRFNQGTEDIEHSWYIDTLPQYIDSSEQVLAWTPLVEIWKEFTKELKTFSSYRATISTNHDSFDPTENSNLPLDEITPTIDKLPEAFRKPLVNLSDKLNVYGHLDHSIIIRVRDLEKGCAINWIFQSGKENPLIPIYSKNTASA